MEFIVKESRKVWIPNHPTHGYRPGLVDDNAESGEFLTVFDDEGNKFQVARSEALAVDAACLTGVEDLLTLGDFNEPALLHNIRVRYDQDSIYTGIGMPILISVNPYQNIPGLYSQETMRQYKRLAAKAPSQSGGGLPIHLYTVADAAYRAMLSEKASQSIIISGESGAGKTEATKRMLAYLAELQSSKSEHRGGRRSVESQVLDANPVLEAFGNAKTVRNDNSSRFGKFIEVEFDSGGKLLSAQISNYLLEKCRIVHQQPEERNYHIFYQLCTAFSKGQVAKDLQLQPASDFEYSKECTEIAGLDDDAEFTAVLDCMSSLGFTQEERDTIFRIVAAVLHLGEVEIVACARNGSDGVSVAEDKTLPLVCDLLGVTSEQMNDVLEHKTFEDPLTETIIHRPHDVSSASFTRHSMAKVVYARLFDWLVWRINESISHKNQQKDVRKIGLLDIYGFEVFEWNSFEQLCINFANEKLQQHFNMHMFSLEQRLYTSEGINWSHITWQDNQHIIDSLDKRPLGLFCLVDSECLMPQSTDSSLFTKILNNFRSSKVIYKASRFGNTDFGVAHYAGEVVYSVETFLMKNTDKLSKDVVSLFKNSEVELVRRLFTDPRFAPPEQAPARGAGARSARRGARQEERQRQNVTVSMMFREQLERLVEDLNKTNPRYVRCIKPNGNKRPNELDSLDVLRQLRCAGMLESIRIRRAGYAVRRPFKEFFARFRILAPNLVPGPDPDYRSLCQRLVLEVEERLGDAAKQQKLWQLGQSRVFMKEDLERKMEQMIVESAKRQVQTIQRCWRGFVGRRYFVQVRRAAMTFQATFRTLQQREAFLHQRHAALQIQATLQTILARDRFAAKSSAAVEVQALLRTAAAMAAHDLRKAAAAAAAAAAEAAAAEAAAAQAAAAEAAAVKAAAVEAAAPMEISYARDIKRELFPERELSPENGKAQRAQLPPATVSGVSAPLRPSSSAASPVSNDLELSRREGNTWTSASSGGLSLDASIRNAALNLGGGGALDSLRSELMARLEGPTGGAPVLDPSHPLSSSLRSIGDPSAAPGAHAEGPQEVPTRATIVNQRIIMKQLQQEFAEALIGKEEEVPPMPDLEASQERQQLLEEELRRLQRENGTLKTDLASSKEEAEAQKQEAKALLAQVSDLKSDLDDVGFGHRDETKVLQRQIQELRELSQQQSDELRQKSARLEEVEGRANHWESEAREALKAASSGKERLEELHKKEEKTRHKLEDTGVVLQESQSSWRAEQERLKQELQSKDSEIAKLKEVLAMHAPKEELQRWRSRCEDLQAQVEQANLANRKMQSAVGHMSNAACARGGDLQELHRRNLDLAHEYEKQKAELKRMDLEKRELKDQIENVDVSLKYFQGKYQDTMKDLKLQKEQSNEYAQSLASAQKLIRELQAENQRLQRGEPQPAAFPAANGRVHGAYPVSQANLHASRHPSIQEAPNEVEIGRQSLLTQLDSGIFRS